MKKETLIKMFEEHKCANFKIQTDIARGRGINGVEYLSYWGLHLWSEGSYVKNNKHEKNKIERFDDECLVLRRDTNADASWDCGVTLIYIPYEKIVEVLFIQENYGNVESVYPAIL